MLEAIPVGPRYREELGRERTDAALAGEVCKHEDLSLDPQHTHKAGHHSAVSESLGKMGGSHKRIPGSVRVV